MSFNFRTLGHCSIYFILFVIMVVFFLRSHWKSTDATMIDKQINEIEIVKFEDLHSGNITIAIQPRNKDSSADVYAHSPSKKPIKTTTAEKNPITDMFRNTRQKFLPPEQIHLDFDKKRSSIDESISGIPIAFGDYDSDRYTDVYVLTEHGTRINVLKGQYCVDGRTIFSFFGNRECLSVSQKMRCDFSRPIYNLVTSDFTGSLRQDLLITIRSASSTANEPRFDILLVEGESDEYLDCSEPRILIANALSEPFVLDFNGDMVSDFIVETPDCSFYMYIGGNYTLEEEEEISSIEGLSRTHGHRFVCVSNLTGIKHFAKPHASGFLNLNPGMEDLTPDMFINGKDKFEYLYNTPNMGFGWKKSLYNFPDVRARGQSAFVDINYDGRIEHVVPVCHDSNDFKTCNLPDLMVFDLDSEKWVNVLNNSVKPLGDQFERKLTFIEQKVYGYITIPVTLRIADINFDGYPDIIVVMKDKKTNKGVVAILTNRPDNSLEPNRWKRLFELEYVHEYSSDEDILMVTPFDIYDNGRLNLLTTSVSDKNPDKLIMRSYDYFADRLHLYYSFLRIHVISGLCTDRYETEDLCPKHLALGSTPPGVSVCFAGPFKDEQSCSVQMAQTAHFSAPLPFMLFGLGNTLNVINDMSVSIANGNGQMRVRQWGEIIPGSKLVIVPYKPHEPNDWELRVFINMSIYSMISLLTIFCLGVILGIAILFLHLREKREDRVENQKYRQAWL